MCLDIGLETQTVRHSRNRTAAEFVFPRAYPFEVPHCRDRKTLLRVTQSPLMLELKPAITCPACLGPLPVGEVNFQAMFHSNPPD